MSIKKSLPEPASPAKAIYVTIILLIVFALVAISCRVWVQSADEFPMGDSAWKISLTNQITVQEKGATFSIFPPWDTRYARMFAQSLSHTGLRQKRVRSEDDKRDILLVAPKTGVFTVEAVFSIHVSSLARSEVKKSALSEKNRSEWLSESAGILVNTAAAVKVVERFLKISDTSDELIEKLFGYVSNNIRIKPRSNNNSETALTTKRATSLGSARALVALLRTAHLPARIVTGVNLQAAAAKQPYYWLEVYDNEVWIPLDPGEGYMKQMPPYYIPFHKGGSELVTADKASITSTVWKIDTTHAPAALLTSDTRKLTDVLNLNRLSPASRENLGLLLLLPLGVLATEIMRQLMGIRTYGTFTPTLIALAIFHVDRVTAMTIFLLVTVIGISIRSYLPNLNLQRTPRLAIVFTLVSLSMAMVVSGFMYFDPGMDGIVVLLPVVVLTMLVDRIYVIADQYGMRTAMIRLFWTVVSAFISLLVLLQTEWSLWLVSYPELHAITLAIIVIIGLYQGPKLSELPVMSWLHEPESKRSGIKSRSADRRLKSEQQDDGM
jgi:transglutaminase-like putative cysteine protease